MYVVDPPSPSEWPWPLDTVQDWFESLWDTVKEWIDAIPEVVWGLMPAGLSNLATWFEELTLDTWRKIRDFLKDPVGTLKGAFDWVIDFIREHVGWWDPKQSRFVGGFLGWLWDALIHIEERISDAATWVWGQIQPWISSAWKSLTELSSLLWKSLQDVAGWLADTFWGWLEGTLRWLTDCFKWLQGELSTTADWVVYSLTTAIDGGVATIGSWVSEALAGVASALGEALSGFAGWLISGLKDLAKTLAEGLVDLMDVVGEFLMPIIVGFVDRLRSRFEVGSPEEEIQKAVDEMVETTQNRVIRELKKIYESPFDPAKVIAISLGLAGLVIAAQVGVHAAASAAGVEVLGTRLDMTDVVESTIDTMSLNRVVGAGFVMPLEVGLLTPLRYAYNQMFTPLIPPVGDLIRFVVREVITPEKFYETTPYHGLSREWATAYWDAHWVLPAFANVVDAFHRGLISEEELERFLIWHDYSPTPRPGIEKTDVEIMRGLLKTLIPRVDLRYAWELGRLTDEELVEWYRRLGYEEDSELMAEIQIARALMEEMHKVRDEWLRDFIEGFIDEPMLRANLAEIGIGPRRIDYYVTYAVKRREREYKKDLLDYYRDGYMKDLITEEELRNRVAEILVVPEVADLFMEKAYVNKYRKPKGD